MEFKLKEGIEHVIGSAGFNSITFIEMDAFPVQQEAMSNLDPKLRVDWAIYPTLAATGDCSFIMVDLVQGIRNRCPLLAIRFEITDAFELYPAIRSVYRYLQSVDPVSCLSPQPVLQLA